MEFPEQDRNATCLRGDPLPYRHGTLPGRPGCDRGPSHHGYVRAAPMTDPRLVRANGHARRSSPRAPAMSQGRSAHGCLWAGRSRQRSPGRLSQPASAVQRSAEVVARSTARSLCCSTSVVPSCSIPSGGIPFIYDRTPYPCNPPRLDCPAETCRWPPAGRN